MSGDRSQSVEPATLDRELTGLREAVSARDVHLDWSGLSTVDPASGMIFAGQLLALSGLNAKVTLPATFPDVPAFVASGIPYALHVIDAEIAGGARGLIDERYSRGWTPAKESPWRLLFDGEDDGDPDHPLFNKLSATLVNPHWTARRGGLDHAAHLLTRWAAYRHTQDRHVQLLGYAISELLENIREHAVGFPGDSTVHALLLCRATTLSSGTAGMQLAVIDTGPGIPSTVRAKGVGLTTDDAELLRQLLDGELGPWPRARGVGLTHLRDRVETASEFELKIRSGEAELSLADGGKQRAEWREPSIGTAVIVTVALT